MKALDLWMKKAPTCRTGPVLLIALCALLAPLRKSFLIIRERPFGANYVNPVTAKPIATPPPVGRAKEALLPTCLEARNVFLAM